MTSIKLIVTLSMFYLVLTRFTQAEISCASPSVFEGERANITCYFHEDVRLTKKNVKVQKTAPGTATFDPDSVDTVVECFWSDAETFNCDTKDGYELYGKVTNMAAVGITRASKEFEGKYMCETVPSDPSDIKPCVFHVQEKSGAVNINLLSPDLKPLYTATLIVAVLILVVVIFLAVVTCFGKERLTRCLKKICTRKNKRSTNEEGEEIPLTAIEDVNVKTLQELVRKSVRESLVNVAQEDAGVLLFSTLKEIHLQSKIGSAASKTESELETKPSTSNTPEPPTTGTATASKTRAATSPVSSATKQGASQQPSKTDPKSKGDAQGQPSKQGAQQKAGKKVGQAGRITDDEKLLKDEPDKGKSGAGKKTRTTSSDSQGKKCTVQ